MTTNQERSINDLEFKKNKELSTKGDPVYENIGLRLELSKASGSYYWVNVTHKKSGKRLWRTGSCIGWEGLPKGQKSILKYYEYLSSKYNFDLEESLLKETYQFDNDDAPIYTDRVFKYIDGVNC